MEKQVKEYRDHLILADQIAQKDFDKTVFTLSGGAIGISFAFITDIIDPKSMISIKILILAWVLWALSLLSVLFSYYFSHFALRKTIKQIDEGVLSYEHPGGLFDTLTEVLNALGAILFILGLISMIVFVNINLGG